MNPQIIDAWILVVLHAAEALTALTVLTMLLVYGRDFVRNLNETLWRYRSTSDGLATVLLRCKDLPERLMSTLRLLGSWAEKNTPKERG